MNVIPGMRFGALTTKWSWKNHNFRRIWKCTCECGGYCYVKEDALINGIVTDCGKCEENIATYEPQCLINAMGYEAGQILVLPFLLLSVLNTNLTTLYTTRWANNVDKITVGPGTVVTTEIAVPTISGYTPIGAIGFSTKQGLSVYQCSVDGQGKVARVYVYNGTSTTVINEIGQAGVHILYLRNFTKQSLDNPHDFSYRNIRC